MRQTQSNRRGRGRSRKAQNPLTRSYESNGPDVKIRGTAAHISEKYNSLARDALSSSDIVRHENYLQHAEHYNRIIMAAQQNVQNAPNGVAQEGDGQQQANSENGDVRDDGQRNQQHEARKPGRRRRNDGKSQKSGNGSLADENASQGDAIAKLQPGHEEISGHDGGIAGTKNDADDAAA